MRVDLHGIVPLLPCILRSAESGSVQDPVIFACHAPTIADLRPQANTPDVSDDAEASGDRNVLVSPASLSCARPLMPASRPSLNLRWLIFRETISWKTSPVALPYVAHLLPPSKIHPDHLLRSLNRIEGLCGHFQGDHLDRCIHVGFGRCSHLGISHVGTLPRRLVVVTNFRSSTTGVPRRERNRQFCLMYTSRSPNSILLLPCCRLRHVHPTHNPHIPHHPGHL